MHLRTIIVVSLLGAPLYAQQLPPRAAQPIFSMGQPPVWQLYGGGAAVVGKGAPPSNAIVTAGVHRYLLNPVIGALGAAGELYSSVETTPDPGARLLVTSPVVGLSSGIDWNSGTKGLDAIVMYQTAVRRGGLLGGGSTVRLDWRPSRHAFGAGFVFPLNQPFAGRTRPRDTDADLPRAATRTLSDESRRLPSASTSALAVVAEAATLIRAYNNLYSDENERALLAYRAAQPPAGLRYGLHYTAATRAYFEALTGAFTAAVNDSTAGEALTRRARAGALDLVILPYDSLFGQVKGTKDIRGLTAMAHERFTAWLRDSSRVAPGARDAVLGVHARWLDIISTLHDELRSQWRDTRLVWLPLQLVLTPEEYDEQTEVDALIARAVGRPFTDGNALAYLRSADLPMEIARSIFATRDYHVLWTHDFTGRRESGAIDDIGYSMVADVYFPALTRAVARYDSTGKLPAYMILVDQFYYAGRDGRLWMTILENPLSASVKLSGDDSTRADHLRQRQAELRAAVAASRLLQREAADHGGNSWLDKVVKVNVSVVEPSDFSFRSHRILPPFPFIPDNIMRDHRKIAFYDVNEADPYRGSLIVTGVGIGEHYASATWEDRGYRMSGPAVLEVREALRRAFAANDITGDRLPPPLRAVQSPRGTEERMNRRDYVGRALQVHNEVGFGAKESSVARAMLYNLAPPGSVIVVPDPLWVSPTWAAMVAGAAARGCRVYIISPSLANGPNPQPSVVAAQHEVILRLLQVRDRLGGQFRDAGGEMRVGLFTARAPVNDAAGRLREVREGLDRAPWIRQLIPFDASTLATLEQATAQAANGRDATSIAKDEKPRAPQLHQKTQLIARPGALTALVRQPGWENVLAQVMRTQSGQTTKFADQLGYTAPDVDSAATRSNDALLRGFEQARSDADRKAVSFYFSQGTQNQDPRGIMMDGEVSIVVSGFHAAAGVVDLYFLMARTTWIEREAELDQLLPRPKGWMARLGKLFRFAL